VQYIFAWIFAQVGLTIPGALVVFVIVGGLIYWRSGVDQKAINLRRSPKQQRIIVGGRLAYWSS